MKWVFPGFIIFLFLIWWPVEAAWSDFCFNNYDLGIYAQAIQLLGRDDLNPWLSVRDVYLFNDHFDPILFLLVPFKNFLPSGLLAIRFEMLCLIMAAAAPLWLAFRKEISASLGMVSAAFILFSPLTLDAALFPAHPGTWSLAPLSWMLAMLLIQRYRLAVMWLLLLLACKEEYPFVGLAVGAFLWARGLRKVSIPFLLISSLWAVGVFVLRPALLGPSSMYTDAVSEGQGLGLVKTWEGLAPILNRGLQWGLPLIPLFFLSQKKLLTKDFILPALVTLVLVAIRLAGGYWGNHRAAPLAVAGAYVAIFALKDAPISRARVRASMILLIALAAPSLELGTRVWRHKPFKKHCPQPDGRLESLARAEKILRQDLKGPVLAQGNLIPRIVDLPGLAHLGASHRKDFRYLFIEKPTYRNTWPLTEDEFKKAEQSWLQSPEVVRLIDDEYVLLVQRP